MKQQESALDNSSAHRSSRPPLVIGMMGAAVFIIICINLFSFISIRGYLKNISKKNITIVLENSERSRELSALFSDINILINTFYGNNDYLLSEEARLKKTLETIINNTGDTHQKKVLSELLGTFGAFTSQCNVVNTSSHAVQTSYNTINGKLKKLEHYIGGLIVEQTLNDVDTTFVEQLLMLVVGYQESLLEIGKLYAELDSGPYIKPTAGKTDTLIHNIDELTLRFQTITASIPEIAETGEQTIVETKHYRHIMVNYFDALKELGLKIKNLSEYQDRLLSLMTVHDKNSAATIQNLDSKILYTMLLSIIIVLALTIIVIISFGLFILKLFKSMETEVNERMLAEAALRASENEYRSTVTNLQIGIVVHGSDTSILLSNPEATNILGLSSDQMSGKKAIDPSWNFVHEDLKIMNVDEYPVNRVLRSKKPLRDYIVGINRPDREYLTWVIVNAIPIVSDRDELEKVIVNFVDITALKQAELEKEMLESQLRHAAKIETIGTLAGGIAHNFNNILGIIIGNTELAMDDVPDWEPARKNLEEIKKAVMRARDVVQQLLSFSRKSEKEKIPIQIHTIVEDSVGLLRASIPSTIELRHNSSTDTATIEADPAQIHQLLINLCTNAAHAMEDNGGILEIRVDEIKLIKKFSSSYFDVDEGVYIQLTVSDTGCGIDPDIKDRIFDPYFTTKDIGKGSGIGLSVVQGIVRNCEGAISIDSQLNKGTTVKVLFPVISRQITRETVPPEEPPKGTETVLLIDDEEGVINVGQQTLEKLGYHVVIKKSSTEALKYFRSDPDYFDLIITDMTMPQMTGDKLAEEILKIRPDMLIIICTGFSERINRESAARIGIKKYIEKPVNRRELAFVVRDVLDKR